jgi:hypothetical protein
MHLRMTNMHAEAHDAFSHIFASAGAPAFVNAYSESAARYRLSLMPSQNASRHVPWHHCTIPREITHEAPSPRSMCGLYWPRLG